MLKFKDLFRSGARCNSDASSYAMMRQWYQGRLGRILEAEERDQLETLLPRLFGYHLIQLGQLGDCGALQRSPIRHCVILDVEARGEGVGGMALPTALPLASDSVDVVILPHTLELDENPHQVLREAERVLIPEGHVVVLGFNPWSLWGLRKLISRWGGRPPWSSRFLGLLRLSDWVALLGFDVTETHRFFYRPPIANDRIMSRLSLLERAGRKLWPFFSGGYVLVARKRTMALTPIKPRWRRERKLVAPGLAEPTNRGMYRDNNR